MQMMAVLIDYLQIHKLLITEITISRYYNICIANVLAYSSFVLNVYVVLKRGFRILNNVVF